LKCSRFAAAGRANAADAIDPPPSRMPNSGYAGRSARRNRCA
jgi:hypothetical protein